MSKRKKSRFMKASAVVETILMIGMLFAVSYFINQTINSEKADSYKQNKFNIANFIPSLLKFIGDISFGRKGLVSAAETVISVSTCLKNINGSICQTYTSNICNAQCNSSCIPSTPDKISECSIGTCYDSGQGTCQIGSPKSSCESNGGTWLNDPYGNVQQCKKGCCVLGDQAYLSTQTQCQNDANARGAKVDYRADTNTEIGCWSLAQSSEQGACVVPSQTPGNLNGCKFTTKTDCLQNLKGNFFSGDLCSNPGLKTNCQKEATTKCIAGKDGVYWADSCGNPENIYSSNKASSWNNGKILPLQQSCSLSVGNSQFANQGSCGNCNYLLGSICGQKTNNEKLSDPSQDVVCKDITCIDANGHKRQNGESWCSYQGAIGTDNNRGADTVGSRDFRLSCVNGQIKQDPCADYRNEICIESQTNIQGSKFSTAACKTNGAYICYNYNSQNDMIGCSLNQDCFVKHVQVSNNFKFDVCVPKYKPGFDLSTRADGAASICKLGTQSCTYQKSKSLFGSGKEVNKECLTSAFTEQMNDLCMSLGDCGAQVNYKGTLSQNFGISNAPGLSGAYINAISKYADSVLFKGKFIDALNYKAGYNSSVAAGILTPNQASDDKTAEIVQMASTATGVAGLALYVAAHTSLGLSALSSIGLAGSAAPTVIGAGVEGASGITTTVGSATGPALNAVGNAIGAALSLAAIGFTIYGFAAHGDWTSVAILTSVAAVGIGLYAAGLIALQVVGIVIAILGLIFSLFGGTKTVTVTFTCQPWQAPLGGNDCDKCGKDGFPCSQYSCQSLGQNCQLINENSGNAECVNIDLHDVTPPLITPIINLLPAGYTSQIINGTGVKILSSGSDGCISQTYKIIPFGISLDKPAQCRIEYNHTASFNDMSTDLSGTGLFLKNYLMPISIPSLASLGISGYDPNARQDVNIYIRCQDKNGNSNTNEYNINFCIKQGIDTSPAIIIGRNPDLETVAYNATSINASVYTNKPAECNWDYNDKEYLDMANNFTCDTNIEDTKAIGSQTGWQCNSILPISSNNSTFYVRCLDQPWLAGVNYSARNSNTQSYLFNTERSSAPLVIDSVNVENKTLTFGVAPASVSVIAHTSGGLDGTARCSYIYGNNPIEFYQTFSNVHTQVFQSLLPGDMNLPIICEDRAGNTAQKTVSFKVQIDTGTPVVTRVYIQGVNLNLITDEPSLCSYSNDNINQCSFDFNNGTRAGTLDILHTISFDEHSTYYIKCKDSYNNLPGTCSIIVRGGK